MKDIAADDSVIERLELALTSDALPKAARDHAGELLRRLSSPVRVTLFGKPGSGKSELINMFAGRRILPKDAKLPTTELVYGAHEKVTMTSPDGSLQTFDELDLARRELSKAAFIKIEMPLPLLKKITLMEVVTTGDVSAMAAAVDWGTKRTEITLWCAQEFDEQEQVIWGRVPDTLKDHAFLVLSKADILSAEKVFAKRVAALEPIVSEEFHSLFGVATLQAVAAHGEDGKVDKKKFQASGGAALSAEVLRHAERGRRADVDSAELFLARYREQIEKAMQSRPAKAAVATETPDSDDESVVAESATAVEPKSVAPAETTPAPAEAPVSPILATQEATPAKTTNVTLFAEGARYLRRRGESVEKVTDEDGAAVVSHCVDAVEHLIDLFSNDESGCKVADSFLDDLMEASDLMVLMQTETGENPPADAATLLLQLRREMDEKIAA